MWLEQIGNSLVLHAEKDKVLRRKDDDTFISYEVWLPLDYDYSSIFYESEPPSLDDKYQILVVKKIRLRYSIDSELAIQRKRNTDRESFVEYYNFVEDCRVSAKQELGIPLKEGEPSYITVEIV